MITQRLDELYIVNIQIKNGMPLTKNSVNDKDDVYGKKKV